MKALQYRYAKLRSNPMPILAVGLAVVLAYTIFGPALTVLSAAFVAHAGDPGVVQLPGQATTFYLDRIFASSASQRLFYQPLLHSIELTLLTTAVTVVLGVGSGWLAARTDVWGGTRWNGILLLAYMVPSWAFAQTWLTIFKNGRAAGGTGLLESHGVHVPDAVAYGLLPTVIVMSLHLFPIVTALSIDAFGRIDAAQEEAATLLGASRFTIVRRVMLPGIRPTVTSAAMLVAAGVIGDFGAPYVLGLPIGYNVLATSLYGELKNNREGTAAVLATVITLLGVLLIAGDSMLARGAKRFQTLTGGTMRLQTIRLRLARPFAFGLLVLLAIVAFVGPLVILAGSTFVDKLGHISLTDLTVRYWWQGTGDRDFPMGLLKAPDFWVGLRNTVLVAALAAIICAVVGLMAAVLIRTSSGWIGALLRQLTFLPHLVPGVALAAGLITLFVVPRGPIPALYGTFTLIIVGMVISHLPFATRTGIASVAQLGTELEEAARMSGAGPFSAQRRVTLPLLRRTFGTAVLFPFVSGLKELTLIVMLSTIGMQFLPMLSLDLGSEGYTQQANAVTLVITLLAVAGGVLSRRLGGSGALAAA